MRSSIKTDARYVFVLMAAAALTGGTAAAQRIAPGYVDPKPILEAVSKAMGTDKLKCITYSGTGYVGAYGQNRRPIDDWPEITVPRYTRTINYDAKTSREELIREQGPDPDLLTETTLVGTGAGERITGDQRQEDSFGKHSGAKGDTVAGALKQILITNGNYSWNMVGSNAVPEPTAAEQRQLDIILSPHGFVKAAMASDKVTAAERWEEGRKMYAVSFIALGKYRVVASINPAFNHVERVLTWVPNPVLGDMRYDHYYRKYQDYKGIQFPATFHHHYGPDDEMRTPRYFNGYNSFGLNVSDVQPNACGDALAVPAAVRAATIPPVRVESQKVADGVWYLGGSSHNSVAIEFSDFVTVIEAPLNEERSIAVIDEVKKLIPNKQIRYLVATHNHLDHIGGIRTYAHEGATIVLQHFMREFIWKVVLGPEPWTLKPDKLSQFPPEEVLDTGFIFEQVNEKITISDGNRIMDVHHVYGATTRNCRQVQPPEGCSMESEHSPYMLMVHLPKEKILVEADLFNPPAPGTPPTPPGNNERTLYGNVQHLKLDVATILPVHGRPVPWSDFLKVIGK